MKKHPRYRRFGALIYKHRLDMNFTQEQFAELLDISVQQVRNYESGRCCPSFERLLDISSKIQVSVECLMVSMSDDA